MGSWSQIEDHQSSCGIGARALSRAIRMRASRCVARRSRRPINTTLLIRNRHRPPSIHANRAKHPGHFSFAKDDDMIKTFPADRANQPFSMSILPRRSRCGWPVTNPHRVKTPLKYLAVGAIAIADDVPRRRLPAAGLGKLLGDPFSRRTSLPAMRFGVGRAGESTSHRAAEMRVSERQTGQSMRSHRRGCGGTSSSLGMEVSCGFGQRRFQV
jgi:hypothetical protein